MPDEIMPDEIMPDEIMPDEKPAAEDGRETTRKPGQAQPRSDDRIVDGRLDPDAQSPDNERAKPFDPKENDPA